MENGFIGIFEEIVREFDELGSLISAVEIMSDAKLYNHYLKKYKSIEPVALLVKKSEALKTDVQDYRLMLEVETDPEQKILIQNQIAEAEELIEKLVLEAKEQFGKNKLLERQVVSIEITTKNDNEFVQFIKELILDFLKQQKADIEIKKDETSSVFIDAEGNGIYEILKLISGKVKKVQFGDEGVANVVVLKNIECNNEINESDLEPLILTLSEFFRDGEVDFYEEALTLVDKYRDYVRKNDIALSTEVSNIKFDTESELIQEAWSSGDEMLGSTFDTPYTGGSK